MSYAQRRPPKEREASRLRIVLRLARLIALCATARVLPTLDHLAVEFGVSTRTVRRDLQVLQEARLRVPPRPDEHSFNLDSYPVHTTRPRAVASSSRPLVINPDRS